MMPVRNRCLHLATGRTRDDKRKGSGNDGRKKKRFSTAWTLDRPVHSVHPIVIIPIYGSLRNMTCGVVLLDPTRKIAIIQYQEKHPQTIIPPSPNFTVGTKHSYADPRLPSNCLRLNLDSSLQRNCFHSSTAQFRSDLHPFDQAVRLEAYGRQHDHGKQASFRIKKSHTDIIHTTSTHGTQTKTEFIVKSGQLIYTIKRRPLSDSAAQRKRGRVKVSSVTVPRPSPTHLDYVENADTWVMTSGKRVA
ncbi:hypothetical protein TNCV_5070341 [Trichonephila clavipes]|nr:hypothetical protein TNCV_5070341 [Trichonephila clavipes]